ncbi:hydrolase [Streptomyces sp. NWU339]|uniref:serine hydrolase domain-containing protein n=1 Tax=Streptomyces sp. NWU339 TaxID=2185284 RepID=UPI000D672EDE|nr:serine hydrolase domain-containing protein [Streptomyces sp. NWU339]PWI06385.1 hydrolase [Streptomyces sp. NWU339]
MSRSTARPIARQRLRRAAAVLGTAVLTATAVPAVAAPVPTGTEPGLDRAALESTLDAVHEAGMYGLYSSVRVGGFTWKGEAGIADVSTGSPMDADMRHRVGSVTKTFVAVAVLQQVEAGRIGLDDPVGDHLPQLLPGERGRTVTVRMLLNHTSGIGEYLPAAFPSLQKKSPKSLDDNRFRTFSPEELVRYGLEAPLTGEPGQKWSYSNTNYIIAGLLLEKITSTVGEEWITQHVIRKAGLRHTFFPRTPVVPGPHSKAYESLYGAIESPRDYSVYSASAFGTAGALVSTMDDLNRFYRLLFQGRLLGAEQLAEMQRTVPVVGEQGDIPIYYGLGISAVDLPCGRFWGHNGSVFGSGTQALSSADGQHQVAFGINLTKYNELGENGVPKPHPIDTALDRHMVQALCPTVGSESSTTTKAAPSPSIAQSLRTGRT